MNPSGLWHPSRSQPRTSSFGMTFASKNVCPAVFGPYASGGAPWTSVAQASQESQVWSMRDWKKVPPVWLTPPAAVASGRRRISL